MSRAPHVTLALALLALTPLGSLALTACSAPPAATAPPPAAPPAAGSFRFDQLTSISGAGQQVTFHLAALDAAGRPLEGYRGSVHFSSDDPQAELPPDTAFAAGDQGLRAFAATFRTAGRHALFVRDQGGARGASDRVLVTAGPAVSLSLASGDGQTNSVLQPLPEPLAALARDSFGNPAPGARVRFSAVAGGGSVDPALTGSGPDGVARAAATLGPDVGPQRFRAELDGTGAAVEFTATAQQVVPASLEVVSGDAQVGTSGQALPLPLVVKVLDAFGNPAPDVEVSWTAAVGSVTPASARTGPDGLASATATLDGPRLHRFVATVAGLAPRTFGAWPYGLSYEDPPAGGALRLVLNPAATPNRLVLDLVATRDVSGFAVGFDLPAGLHVAPLDLQPGVLSPGANPPAGKAKVPLAGPLKGALVVALSQKRAGDGAVPHDTAVHPGDVLLTVTLGGLTHGLAFDGRPDGFRGGLLDMAGNAVLRESDFAIGRLENH